MKIVREAVWTLVDGDYRGELVRLAGTVHVSSWRTDVRIMAAEENDPTVIRTLVVKSEEVIAAVEARKQRGTDVVLRATQPYSGRMRARLHVPSDGSSNAAPEYVRVDPGDLLAADAPTYPRPDGTEDALRADPSIEYTVDRHRERHERRIAEWRRDVRGYFVDETAIETSVGKTAVDLVVLDSGDEKQRS